MANKQTPTLVYKGLRISEKLSQKIEAFRKTKQRDAEGPYTFSDAARDLMRLGLDALEGKK